MLSHLYPVGSLAESGIPVAFGSDGPVIDPNPWPTIYNAVTRRTNSGNSLLTNASQEQAVTVAQALRMYTAAGAMAEGTGHNKGILQPGMLADLVLLDSDPINAEPEQLKEVRTSLTVLGGEVVWEDWS